MPEFKQELYKIPVPIAMLLHFPAVVQVVQTVTP
jgi:hypothetical protein